MPEHFICTPNWTVTDQGSVIALYHSHPLNALSTLKPFLFVGGVHGDEPEGVYLSEELLARLKSLQTKKAWALITCINPDGYQNQNRVNGNGVDLNRNFPTPDWQASPTKDRYFPGPEANSEKETQALVELIAQIKPACIIHFHSWKPCVVYTGARGQSYAEILSSKSHPAQPDIGYPTPGSLGQYGDQVAGVPVICIEEREGALREEVWQNFGDKLLSLLLEDQSKGGTL